MEVVLRSTSIVKSVRGRRVLNGVSLDLCAGSIVGLIGINGAGKTTLLKILAGALNMDSGDLRVETAAAQRNVLLLPDKPAFMPRLTVMETLRCFVSSCGVKEGSDRSAMERVIEKSGLAGHRNARTSDLSAGLRQRMSWCYALLLTPAVVLLDEPTSFLDPLGVLSLREVVRTLAARGCAILISSHNLDEISRICHQTKVLRGGTLHDVGTLPLTEISPNATERFESLLLG